MQQELIKAKVCVLSQYFLKAKLSMVSLITIYAAVLRTLFKILRVD